MRVAVLAPSQPDILVALLEGLTAANAVILSKYRLPMLYDSGVRYRREGPGREQWLLASQVLRRKFGDCEDLAAWRAAELRVYDGEAAMAWVRRSGPRTWHAVVRRADGSIEDPSRALGMGQRRRP